MPLPLDHSDTQQFVASAIAATAGVESCQYSSTYRADLSDGTYTTSVVEGVYIARQGTYEKHRSGDLESESLTVHDSAYVKGGNWPHAKDQWVKIELDSNLRELAKRDNRPRADLPAVPGSGPVNVAEYSFTYLGEVPLEGIRTLHFAGKAADPDSFTFSALTNSALYLWIDPQSLHVLRLRRTTESPLSKRPGTMSISGSGWLVAPGESEPVGPPPGILGSTTELLLSKFSDPANILPLPPGDCPKIKIPGMPFNIPEPH